MINQGLTCWDVGILKETRWDVVILCDFRIFSYVVKLFGAMLDKDSWKVIGSLMFQTPNTSIQMLLDSCLLD